MGEWKRVFLDPKRMGLLLVCLALCIGMFLLTVPDHSSTGRLSLTQAGVVNDYVSGLVRQWRGQPFDRVTAAIQEEYDTIVTFYRYIYGHSELFDSEDEAYAAIAHIPVLTEAARTGDLAKFTSVYRALSGKLEALLSEAEYLAGYGDYLTGIQSQAQIQSQTSIFGKPGSFSRRNLAKTAEEFGAILGVEVEFGFSLGLTKWLDFETELGDYFHLLALIIIVMSFLEERRRGLWPVIRTTRGGRRGLGLTRIGILLAGSVLAAVLFSLLPFLLSMFFFGGWEDLGRSLQSVPAFSVCPLRITVAEWLLRFFVLKILSGALIGLALWCVLGSLANTQFSVSVLGVTLTAEFVLYELLPVQSILNVLKYFNIFAYVHTSKLYTEYLNVDLFGFPVGIRAIAVFGIAVIGLALALLAVLTQAHRRPEGRRDILGRVAAPLERALDVIRTRLSLGGWEGWKLLIFQYGALLLALAILATGQLSFAQASAAPVDRWYDAYLSDMEGPIDGSTDKYIARARERARESDDAAQLLSALDRVEAHVDELRQRAEKGGYDPWIVSDEPYDFVYGESSRETQRLNAAVAVMLVSVLAAPLWAFERQSGVTMLLHSTRRGRRALFRRKAVVAALLAAAVWAALTLREFRDGFLPFRPDTLSVPVQNLDRLASFPLRVTASQYLALLYAVRLVMLTGVSEAAMCVGFACPSVRTAYVASFGLLGIPALLTALGVEMFKWASPVVPVASAEIMWSLGSARAAPVFAWIVWLAVSAVIFAMCGRRWVKSP